MVHRFVFHNDRLLPIESVRLSPGQAGLLSGWGLFTTLRIAGGVPFAYERHWKRLEKDAARTHCPFPFEAEKVRGQLYEVLHANGVVEGSARIYVVNNEPNFWASEEKFRAADLVIYSAGAASTPRAGAVDAARARAARGIAAGGREGHFVAEQCLEFVRSAAGRIQRSGAAEERGEVSECTAANIFCVRGGRVQTPPLDSGCLEGITRSVLLEIGKEAGVAVEERALRPEDLYAAEEIFISSTNRGLLGVGEIAGHWLRRRGR